MRILLWRPTRFCSNLIWSFMIIIIIFLTNWCRNHWNWFPWWTTFQFWRRYKLPFQALLSSHSLLSRETPSLERIHLSNKYFAFGSVIEGVPNSFLWVFYEDALLRFGFELIRLKLFRISIAAPNLTTTLISCQEHFIAKVEQDWDMLDHSIIANRGMDG